MTTPAVTLRSSPVTAAELSEARNAQACATSAASTIRPSGDASVSAARACSSVIPRMAACLRDHLRPSAGRRRRRGRPR